MSNKIHKPSSSDVNAAAKVFEKISEQFEEHPEAKIAIAAVVVTAGVVVTVMKQHTNSMVQIIEAATK